MTTTFEYALNWKSTCNRTYQLLPRCTQNPLHGEAHCIHHIKYKRSWFRRILGMLLFHFPKKSVSGLEIIGWDVVPLCYGCHFNAYGRTTARRSVHYVAVWRQLGALENHNVWWFAWKLRLQFWLWASLFQLYKLLFFWTR